MLTITLSLYWKKGVPLVRISMKLIELNCENSRTHYFRRPA
uniref:Uncharacterized protein n=1 Tax=Anguilla anguilla TaxID=7936 RepID=A0A0E9S654_ANGAN